VYLRIASRRIDISVACGMAACGIPAADDEAAQNAAGTTETPASKQWRIVRMVVGNGLALLLFAAFLAQSEANNPVPGLGLGKRELLLDVASWSRMMAPWNVLAPNPPSDNGRLVVDAETKGGWVVDLISGHDPDLELDHPRDARRSVLWAAYTDRIRQKEYDAYLAEFRRYLTRGGFAVEPGEPANYISRFAVIWLSVDTPRPGQPREGEIRRVDLLGHGTSRPPAMRPGARTAPQPDNPEPGDPDPEVPQLRRFPQAPFRP
jgi:hypothetical protein